MSTEREIAYRLDRLASRESYTDLFGIFPHHAAWPSMEIGLDIKSEIVRDADRILDRDHSTG